MTPRCIPQSHRNTARFLSHQSSVMEMNRCAADCDFVVIADTNGVIQGGESLSSLSPALFPSENMLKIQNKRPSFLTSPATLPCSTSLGADVQVSAIGCGHCDPAGQINQQHTSDVALEGRHSTQQRWELVRKHSAVCFNCS